MNPIRYLLHCYRRWCLGRWIKHNLEPYRGVRDSTDLRKILTDNSMKDTDSSVHAWVEFKSDGPNRNGDTYAHGCFVHRNPGCFPQLKHKDSE